MKISKIASTVILATSFATFFLFAFLFYLYGDFKEALSDTASFFGGIATLVAAYIATQLFNDWRDIHRAQYISSICEKLTNSILSLNSKIFYLEIILDSTDALKGGFPIAFVTVDKKNEILSVIPGMKSLCKEITHDVRQIESDILLLKYVSMNAFLNINLLYSDLRKAIDINHKKVLANRDIYMEYTILNSCKNFISVSNSKLKSLQDAILKEVNILNSPK